MAIKTGWDLSDVSAVNYVVEGIKGISSPLQADFDISTGIIKPKYNGKEFQSLSNVTQGYHDTIILDPKIHGQLSNYDLEYFGTFFHVHDIGLKMNKNIMYISLDGSAITPDYATWIIRGDIIEVELLIDPTDVKSKLIYAGIRQHKILDYLAADPDVQIIDDGIKDAAVLLRERMDISSLESQLPIKQTPFGKIAIRLDVGFPDTVTDLINYIKQFKLELYRKVK